MKSNTNLADPLVFNTHDGMIFCRDNVCAECQGPVFMTGKDGSFVRDSYNIKCFKCKHMIYEGGYIAKSKLAEIEHNQAVGERQMQDDKPMTRDQAIKDLGF